jgi:hypothetical protein
MFLFFKKQEITLAAMIDLFSKNCGEDKFSHN